MSEVEFIEILNSLEKASDDDELQELSKSLSVNLKENRIFFESYVNMLLSSIIRVRSIPSYNDEHIYFESDFNIYRDSDGFYKMTIEVAFVQDYRNSEQDFDNELMEEIKLLIKSSNLHKVINDINVNSLQELL